MDTHVVKHEFNHPVVKILNRCVKKNFFLCVNNWQCGLYYTDILSLNLWCFLIIMFFFLKLRKMNGSEALRLSAKADPCYLGHCVVTPYLLFRCWWWVELGRASLCQLRSPECGIMVWRGIKDLVMRAWCTRSALMNHQIQRGVSGQRCSFYPCRTVKVIRFFPCSFKDLFLRFSVRTEMWGICMFSLRTSYFSPLIYHQSHSAGVDLNDVVIQLTIYALVYEWTFKIDKHRVK